MRIFTSRIKCVLLPIFADPNDDEAIQIMERLFPSRRIVPIDCRELILGAWRLSLPDAAAARDCLIPFNS